MAEFIMPSLGTDMEAGTLIEWKVKPGDCVQRGDIIAEVETDKGVIEVEVFEEGVIDRILVQPDMTVPVGTVLAVIRSVGAAATPMGERPQEARVPVTAEPQAEPRPEEGRPVIQPPPAAPPITAQEKRLRASPLARKLAAELGVDLRAVHGTGPDGAIERADVEHAAAAVKAVETPPPPPEPPTAAAPPPTAKPAVPDFQARMAAPSPRP